MSVRIRLTRAGRRHLPFYHISIFDKRQRRDGEEIERIGTYDPTNVNESKQITVNGDRAQYWLGVGAFPSETVAGILKKSGVELPEQKKTEATRKPAQRKKAAGVKERTKKRTANSKKRGPRNKGE